MNWDEMPAGPEMDRAVAEKVCGWTHVEDAALGAFSPSTDLNAAVAACGRRAWAVESNDLDVAYCATVEGHEEIAPTPALALCRALLKAAS